MGYQWTDFDEISYLSIFRKSVKKIRVLLKSDRKEKFCLDKSCKENQNTHFMFNNFFFFRKSCRLWGNLENMVQPDRAEIAVSHSACTLHAGKLRLKKYTCRIFHTYCFSTATMVTQTRLSLALYKYIARLVCAVKILWTCFNHSETPSIW